MGAGLLVIATAAGLLAIAVLIGWFDDEAAIRAPRPRRQGGQAAAAVGTFVVVIVVSGWVVPAAVLGIAAWCGIAAWRHRQHTDRSDIARIEALAAWVENLRDVLLAGEQPIGAITATVATCPMSLRPAVRRLAAALGRQDPEVVFRRFADDLDDPIGDVVAIGLSIAVRRGARTVAVLSAVAEQARQQADRRRLVDAERAPAKREIDALTFIMTALVLGLFVLGRSEYLRAYDALSGQVFLGASIGVYAALLGRVRQLARFPRPARFLTIAAGMP